MRHLFTLGLFFGLIFTLIFYVVVRNLADGSRPSKPAP
jgi:hypothetical protein